MQKKTLSRLDVFSLVLGSIIGWGSFSLPATRFLPQSGIINTAIGLALGGLVVIVIQNSYHIMLENHGEDGGEFSYTYENLGKRHGFIVGWSLVLCYICLVPLNATAFSMILNKVLGINTQYIYLYTVGSYPVYLSEIIISSLILLLFARINIRGLKFSSVVQNTLVFFLVFNVLVIFLFYVFRVDSSSMKTTYFQNYEFSIGQIFKVFAIAPFTFVGFDVIPQVTTNLNFNKAKATTVAITSIIIGISLYVMLNVITSFDFHIFQSISDWPLASSISKNMGIIGKGMLLLAVTGAVVGGINGFMISSSKLISSLGEYKFLNKKYNSFNKVGANEKSIIFVLIVSLIAPWFGREVISYIVDMSSLLASVAYLYVCFIAIKKSTTFYSKVLAWTGSLFSLGFILLLVVPISPAFLSTMPFVFLVIWWVLGMIYYAFNARNVSKKLISNE